MFPSPRGRAQGPTEELLSDLRALSGSDARARGLPGKENTDKLVLAAGPMFLAKQETSNGGTQYNANCKTCAANTPLTGLTTGNVLGRGFALRRQRLPFPGLRL